MRNNHKTYCVFLDVASHPQMYGIRGTNGICVGRISTDFQEVNRLAGRGWRRTWQRTGGEVLFDRLKIVEKAKKTKTGQ